MEQVNEDHDGGDGHGDDQVLGLGKEEREKQNGLKAKVILWQNLLNYRAHMHLSLSNDL